MKILLINLPSKRHKQFTYPLGLNRIEGAIRASYPNIQSDLIDSQYIEMNDLLISVSKNNYDIIGISAQLESQNELFGFLNNKIVKSYLDSRRIIVGGNLVSNSYESILNKYKDLILAIGEGENTIVDYIKFIKKEVKLSDVKGIVYYDNKIKRNEKTRSDLNTIIPVKKESLINTNKYKGDMLLCSSRGCGWGACAYCFKDPNRHHKFELLDDNVFLQELKHLKELGVNDASLVDPCVLGGGTKFGKMAKIRMVDLCYKIIKNTTNINIAFSLRVDDVFKLNNSNDDNNFNLAVLNVMKKAGFNLPFLGIESNSNTQLKRYNKGILPIENINAITRIKRIWNEISMGIIMFDPFVNSEEILETIKFIDKFDLYDAMSYPLNQLKVQKGAQYFNKCLKENLITGYDNKTLLYEVAYKDKKIQSIIDIIKLLEYEAGSILYLAKLKSRTNRMAKNNEGNNILHTSHVKHNRLQITLVKELILNSNSKQALTKFRKERNKIVESIKINIKNNKIEDINKILSNEILKYEMRNYGGLINEV